MRYRLTFLMLPLVLLVACNNPAEGPGDETPQGTVVEAGFNEEFDLRVGRTAYVGGQALTIAFRRASNDSRCPSDAVCVWMGDATVHLDVTVGRMAWTPAEVHTHVEPKQTNFRDFTIALVSLTPYPRSDRRIEPDDYVARLRVTRR